MQYGGAFGMCEYIAYVSSGVYADHMRAHTWVVTYANISI